MTRTRRLGVVACPAPLPGALPGVLLAVLLVGAAGCGDDPAQSQDDPSTSPSSTAASTPASTPGESSTTTASPTTPPTPSVAPATGIELVEASSAVRVPAGWVQQEALLDYASAATDPGKLSTVQLADSGSISGGAGLDALAQGAIAALPKGAEVERLPDVDLGGVPAFHLHYTLPGDPQEYDTVTTEHNGRNVGLDFFLPRKTAATNPDLIASVLATFRWTA